MLTHLVTSPSRAATIPNTPVRSELTRNTSPSKLAIASLSQGTLPTNQSRPQRPNPKLDPMFMTTRHPSLRIPREDYYTQSVRSLSSLIQPGAATARPTHTAGRLAGRVREGARTSRAEQPCSRRLPPRTGCASAAAARAAPSSSTRTVARTKPSVAEPSCRADGRIALPCRRLGPAPVPIRADRLRQPIVPRSLTARREPLGLDAPTILAWPSDTRRRREGGAGADSPTLTRRNALVRRFPGSFFRSPPKRELHLYIQLPCVHRWGFPPCYTPRRSSSCCSPLVLF
jgi:hypothetical protein